MLSRYLCKLGYLRPPGLVFSQAGKLGNSLLYVADAQQTEDKRLWLIARTRNWNKVVFFSLVSLPLPL